MKIFYTLILYLCALSAFSQTNETAVNTNGTYLFQKAIFTTSNYNTKAEVNSRIITDPSSLDASELFFLNVFLQATVNDEVLLSCMLPDGIEYLVKGGTELVPTKVLLPTDERIRNKTADTNQPLQLAPYSLSIQNNTLTFTVRYLYGDSRYNFPLEGKLVVTLTKQK